MAMPLLIKLLQLKKKKAAALHSNYLRATKSVLYREVVSVQSQNNSKGSFWDPAFIERWQVVF